MLVITRRPGQSVVVDGPATIKILGRKSCGKVIVGIDAATDVAIVRGELLGDGQSPDGRRREATDGR